MKLGGKEEPLMSVKKIKMCKVVPAAPVDASVRSYAGAGGLGFTWQDARDMLSFLCQHIM